MVKFFTFLHTMHINPFPDIRYNFYLVLQGITFDFYKLGYCSVHSETLILLLSLLYQIVFVIFVMLLIFLNLITAYIINYFSILYCSLFEQVFLSSIFSILGAWNNLSKQVFYVHSIWLPVYIYLFIYCLICKRFLHISLSLK